MAPLPDTAKCDPPQAKILVVEDEVVVGIDLQTKLQSLGYTVPDVIRYGEQVDEFIISENPDLVLLDINLKGEMTGTEAGKLLADRYHLPIIYLTAFSDEKTVAEAKKSNPYAFLCKPVNYENLRLTIEIALYKAQLEQQLKYSQERLEMAIEGAELGTWDWNIETGRVNFNDNWAAMLGYELHEIDNHVDSWSKLLHPDDTPEVMRCLTDHLENHTEGYSTEHRLLAKSGEWKWVQDSGKVTERAPNGKALRMVGVHKDITERKLSEQLIHRSELNLRNFFNTGIDFNWVLNQQGHILAINDTVKQRLGYSETELLGQSVLMAHPPERRTEAERIIKEMLQGESSFCPVPLMCKSGAEIPVETYISEGYWNGQKALFGISKDISQLRLSEEKFSTAFQNTPAIVGLSSAATGRYIDINQTFIESLGFNKSEVLGKSSTELGILDPQVRKDLLQELKKAGHILNREVPIKTKTGKELTGLFSAQLINLQEEPIILTTIVDISPLKQAKQELQTKENFLSNILDSVQDGINVLDLNFNIIRVNKALEQQYASSMPLVGKKCYTAFWGISSPCSDCPSATALETGQISCLEMEVPHPKGEAYGKGWIELYAYPLMENGQITGVIEYARDITERKSAEIAREQAQQQVTEILNSIDANVYVATLDTLEIQFMNQHMIEDFGEDLTGQSCWQSLHQRSAPCPNCTNANLTTIDEKSSEPYIWESHNEITGKTYLHHDRLIRWSDGQPVRLQIATDISKIRRMEEQLRQKYKMEAIGTMANGIAHNLNNNLAIVLGNLELAQLKLNEVEKLQSYIEKSKAACFRSRDLIKQLATYGNKASGQKQKGVFDLDDLVESSLLLITHSLPENIKLSWDRQSHNQPLQIRIDSSQLEEVLINLANNANTAMQNTENGVLDISTALAKVEQKEIPSQFDAVPGHYAVLSVQDNGCGIPDELISQIFDPFFSTREVYEATGMGLSIIEGIMKQSQGFIKVSSTPGQGSRFLLYFPLASNSTESS